MRGPYGNRVITTLPPGAARYPWRGHDYWYVGFGWYRPCWVGESVHYAWVYPPAGFYYASLPTDYTTVVVNNNTYYVSDGVYYQEGVKEGSRGYVVAEQPPVTDTTEGVNPIAVLQAMCDYVSDLGGFSLVAGTTTDEVRASGDKVQVSARRIMWVSRPNRFAIDVAGDKGERRMVYDGKTVTMLDRTQALYTEVNVPETIDGALDELAQHYGIVLPLEDLMYKTLYERLSVRMTSAEYLGLHRVGGVACHHVAFSTESADCEVWIDAGRKPVLRRFTIDYRRNTGRQRYVADILEWTESPALSAQTFESRLPPIVRRFELTPVNP